MTRCAYERHGPFLVVNLIGAHDAPELLLDDYLDEQGLNFFLPCVEPAPWPRFSTSVAGLHAANVVPASHDGECRWRMHQDWQQDGPTLIDWNGARCAWF